MKPAEVNYRNLKLSNLNSPEYSHLKLLWSWVGYFLLFFLTENLIPPEKCHVIHSPLDDLIPFCEAFTVFYVGWYLLVAGSLLYFLLYSVESFKRLQTYIIITQILAMTVYIVYPSRQELRPEAFPRENVLTWIMGIIYRVDTNTGVLPSLHVAYSVAVASTWLREKSAKPWVRGLITLFCLGVCVSVSFVKQHSVLDIFAALPVCAAAEWFVFWRKKKPIENRIQP